MHLVSGHNLNIFLVNFLTSRVTCYSGRVGLTCKKLGQVTSQPVFASGKRKSCSSQVIFGSGRVESEISNPYCHV